VKACVTRSCDCRVDQTGNIPTFPHFTIPPFFLYPIVPSTFGSHFVVASFDPPIVARQLTCSMLCQSCPLHLFCWASRTPCPKVTCLTEKTSRTSLSEEIAGCFVKVNLNSEELITEIASSVTQRQSKS
jgi:hypothetical protein